MFSTNRGLPAGTAFSWATVAKILRPVSVNSLKSAEPCSA